MTTSFCPFKNANSPARGMPASNPAVAPFFPQACDSHSHCTCLPFWTHPSQPHSPLTSQAPARITLSGFLHHAHFLHTRLSRCSLCLQLIPSFFSGLLIHSAFIPVHLCRHWIPESPDPDSEVLFVGLHFVRLLLSIRQNVPSSGGLPYGRP